MSEKKSPKLKTEVQKTAVGFSLRNIKKNFAKFGDNSNYLTHAFHLELGEKGAAVIVQDKDEDWIEIANKDIDSVGLANVLEIARRRHEDPSIFMFQDSQAGDISDLDPMQPQSIKEVVASGEKARSDLQGIADYLGVSLDEFLNAFKNGTLNNLVKKEDNPSGGEK